ncbi:MAG: hypothetical protein ACE5H9_00545 [Anaerolineae bacterium]
MPKITTIMETKHISSATEKRWPRLDLIFIAGLTLFAFALRVYRSGAPSLWYDELLELDIAQGPFLQIWPQLERHAAMPLDYYLLHGWLQLGRQEAWVRFPALVFGTLAVPLIYALGRRLFNRRVGATLTHYVGSRFATVVSQPETLTLPPQEKPNRGSGPPIGLAFFVDKVFVPLSTTHKPTLLLHSAFFLAAVVSLGRRGRHDREAILLLLGWLLLPILLIYLFLLQRGTFYAIRYILYTLPAYLILVAYGIDALAATLLKFSATLRARNHPHYPGRILPGSLLLLALIPLLLAELDENLRYYSTQSREDWRAVGQLLWENAQPDDVVIAVKAEPAINRYYPPARAPSGTYSRSEPIWQALQAHEQRWFVLSSYSQKRDQGLRTWLREHNAVLIAIDRRVIVYFHQAGLSADELLAQVKTFSLPPKALTYTLLADQLMRNGDLEAGRALYRQAIDLTETDIQKADYQARLANLKISQ